MDALHELASLLICKAIALKDHRIVIVQRLDKIGIMPEPLDKLFEASDGRTQQTEPPSYLSGCQPGLQSGMLRAQVSHSGAELCGSAIRHFVDIEARRIRII